MTNNYIRFDWAIKRLLRNKADYTVLEGFLSVLLERDIKIVNITESESNKTNKKNKVIRVDVMVEESQGELMVVEIQTSYEFDYYLRMLYATSKAIAERLIEGDRYYEVRKVYHINILYFPLSDGDYAYRGGTELRGINTNKVLDLSTKQINQFVKSKHHVNAKTIKDLHPEYYILCASDFNQLAKTSIEEWMHYLRNTEIPDSFTAKGLEKAREQLRYDLLTEDEKRDYDAHLGYLAYERNIVEDSRFLGEAEGREKGLAEGLEKGEAIGLEKGEAIGLAKGEAIGHEKAMIATALRLHAIGISIEDIVVATSLPQEQIIKIIKSI
jgi:predicted transposase/invertase (TIGR01784 family)